MGDRRGLSARQHETVQALELVASPHGDNLGAESLQRRDVFTHVALEGEHANAWHYQPRSARRTSSVEVSAPSIAAPRPVDTLATTLASRKCVVASTMA